MKQVDEVLLCGSLVGDMALVYFGLDCLNATSLRRIKQYLGEFSFHFCPSVCVSKNSTSLWEFTNLHVFVLLRGNYRGMSYDRLMGKLMLDDYLLSVPTTQKALY